MASQGFVKDSVILDNQKRAAALGVTIPGLSSSNRERRTFNSDPKPKKEKPMKNEAPVRRYTQSAYEKEIGSGPMSFSDSDAERIREDRYRQNQGLLDSINSVFDQKLKGVQAEGTTALNRQRAIASRSGLVGSGRGERQREDVVTYNKEQEGYVQEQRMAKINEALFQIEDRAEKEIEAKRLEAAGNRTAYLDFLKDAGTNARNEIKNLSGLGVTMDELAPEDIEDFMKYTGLSKDTIRLMWNAGLPKEEKVDYKYEVTDRGVLAYGMDPKTGKVVSEYVDVPELGQGEELKEVDGVLYAVSKDSKGGYTLRPLTDRQETESERKDREAKELAEKNKGQTALDIYTLADSLLTEKGMGGAVGGSFQKLIPGLEGPIPGTAAADYTTGVNQLKDILALPNLEKLKGAMSDKDIMFLRNIGTRLSTDMSETAFKKELQNIKDKVKDMALAEKAKQEGGGGYSSIDDYLNDHPEDDEAILKTIDDLKAENPDATDDEIEAAILEQISMNGNFEQVGNTSASIQIPKTSRLAYVNNNPGNLKFAGQRGAVRGEKGFAKFDTPEAGFEALVRQVNLDQGRGLTLSQFIHKFAPASENNTELYIQQLEKALGVSRDDKIGDIEARTLARAVAKKESSTSFA